MDVVPNKSKPSQSLVELNRECKTNGITRLMIAVEAAKTARGGSCSLYTVSKVMRGHTRSANVFKAAAKLLKRRAGLVVDIEDLLDVEPWWERRRREKREQRAAAKAAEA